MSDAFFKLLDGTDLSTETNDGNYDTGGGSFTLIPEGTEVLAMAEEVKWAKAEGDTAPHISLRWTILAPDALKNRKVFQKCRVKEASKEVPAEKRAAKIDSAKRMFAAIDYNCGGNLLKAGREPSDADLMMHIANKMMVLKVGVIKMRDNSYMNFVAAVSSKDTKHSTDADVETAQKRPEFVSMRSAAGSTPAGRSGGAPLDDEIPF